MPFKLNGTTHLKKRARRFQKKPDFYGFLMVFLDYKLFLPKMFEIFGSEMPSL